MAAVRPVRILYMEDDPGSAHLLQRHLGHSGYDVTLARDGRVGLELCGQQHFDVLVVDQNMPVYEGIQVVKMLSATGSLPPTIMITGMGNEKLAVEAIKLGVGDYLVKDVDGNYLELLPTVIEQLLEKQNLLEERQRSIDERARLVEQLSAQTVELQAHNEELEAFAHTVAHDLKNPIELMIGYAGLITRDYGDVLDESAHSYVEAVVRGGHKASAIIDDLLLLAEVRKGEVHLSAVDMGAIVDEALRRQSLEIESQNGSISVPKVWPEALGYAPWLEEVWVNYLSNALKYGSKPPYIQFGATLLDDEHVRFWIRNRGDVLSTKDLSRLFRPFTRLSKGHADGHGLGLSIVHRIVEKMGGQVGADNQEGFGPVFSFTLQRNRQAQRRMLSRERNKETGIGF